MTGTVEYLGESKYYHIRLRDSVKTVEHGDIIKLPLNVCKRLWDSCLFVPDLVTKKMIADFENQKVDSYHVDGRWEGEDVFLIGAGSSLKGFDFSLLKNKKTIVINHMITECPGASALLFFDREFVNIRKERIQNFKGLIFSSMRSGYRSNTKKDYYYSTDLRNVPDKFNLGLYGKRSSLAALNLALVMGAKRVYLLGYDLVPGINDNYAYRPLTNRLKANQNKYTKQIYCNMRVKEFEVFNKYKHKIFNCNPDSGIKLFEFKNIKKALK